MMDDMSAEPRHARLSAVRILRENPVLVGIAGIGFFVSFQTIARLAQSQHMPGYPVLYPVLIDLGILGFIIEARKAIDDGRSDLVPRALAWVLAGFTVYVNAHGSPARDWLGVALHVVAPALWVAFLELTRWRSRRRRREAREGIPFARWVLSPGPTFLLYKRMVMWEETSYRRALDREQVRRRAMAALRALHGAGWRKTADQFVVRNLTRGIDVEGAAEAVRAEAERAAKAALRASSPASPSPRRSKGKPPAARVPRRPTVVVPPDPDTDDLTTEMRALSILAAEPGISGNELGRRLGTSTRYGRDLKSRLAPVAAQTGV